MKYFFFDRFKYSRDQSNKHNKSYHFIQFFNNVFTSYASSFIALLFTYPFDLAYSRKAGKLVLDGNYNNFRNCFHTKIDTMIFYDIPLDKMMEMQKKKSGFLVSKYYEGFSFALMLSSISLVANMTGFEFIRNKVQNSRSDDAANKYSASNFFKLIGYTSALTIITSPIIYPFDTLLRQNQVNGARGYNNKFDNGFHNLRNLILKWNVKGMYR